MKWSPENSDKKNSEEKIEIRKTKKKFQKQNFHGSSAWKIAYADFMTAMMAFFLLLWLLSSASQHELKGIQDYFNAPLKITLLGGNSSGNRNDIINGGGENIVKKDGQIFQTDSEEDSSLNLEDEKNEQKNLLDLQTKIENLIKTNPSLKEFETQILMEITPDGLEIQIIDEYKRPMFALGSSQIQPYMQNILHEIGFALKQIKQNVRIAGHTDARPYAGGVVGYSNWELSVDRANASRRELVRAGLSDKKLAQVVGLNANDLLIPENPFADQNRRISLTILTTEAEKRLINKQHLNLKKIKELNQLNNLKYLSSSNKNNLNYLNNSQNFIN